MPRDAELRALYIGLDNARVTELQAQQFLAHQIGLVDSSPNAKTALLKHVKETSDQSARLETCLDKLHHEFPQMLDRTPITRTSLTDGSETFDGGDPLQTAMFQHAFEQFEASVYQSLIALARVLKPEMVEPLMLSLREEEEMLTWTSGRLKELELELNQLEGRQLRDMMHRFQVS